MPGHAAYNRSYICTARLELWPFTQFILSQIIKGIKFVKSNHLLSLIFMNALNSKRIVPMRNQLIIRLNGDLQDKILGGKSCTLGIFSHIGKSKMLEIKVTV